MQFSIEPIMCVVASATGPGNSAPCHLDPLMTLIRHVTGDTLGPSVPGFMAECVATGLVVIGQYPKLAEVQFAGNLADDSSYDSWLRAQRRRLDLPGQLPVERPSSEELRDAKRRADPIVEARLRHLIGNY